MSDRTCPEHEVTSQPEQLLLQLAGTGGGSVYVQIPGHVDAVHKAVNFLLHAANYGESPRKGLSGFAEFCSSERRLCLKLLAAAVDICVVRRSALVTGLSLALCGVTLVGIGEWAAGRFENTEPDGGSSATLASPTNNANPAGEVLPALPVLPETSDHLPADYAGYTYHRDIHEVRLQFAVSDEQGRIINNLSSDDVLVFDDQAAVAHFNEFARDDDLPLQIGVLLDTSDSVKRVLPEEKAAAIKFLQRTLRPHDIAFVIGFGGDVKVWQTASSDLEQLVDAIARLKEPGWGTHFYDALYSACQSQLAPNYEGKLVHRALVVLSDGDDTDSLRGLRDAIAIAQRSEVQIYALTIRSGKAADRGDLVLERLTDGTGGRLYVAPSSKDLDTAFGQIERDLRTQYYVSFPPQQPKAGFHSLRVEIRAPQKLQVHARQGYYVAEE
jgi:Ca-activated chloride channel homolog